MSWTIEPLPPEGPRFEAALAVYRDAFSRPPYNDRERAAELRRRIREVHAQRPGFRAFAAVHGDGRVLGMIYGYRGAPGQWWHDAVAAVVTGRDYQEWLSSSFELTEVAVAPAFQSFGIGRALIRHLLEGLHERTCVLSTRTDSRAHHLYARLGFATIAQMRFIDGGHLFYVMGRRLDAQEAAAL